MLNCRKTSLVANEFDNQFLISLLLLYHSNAPFFLGQKNRNGVGSEMKKLLKGTINKKRKKTRIEENPKKEGKIKGKFTGRNCSLCVYALCVAAVKESLGVFGLSAVPCVRCTLPSGLFIYPSILSLLLHPLLFILLFFYSRHRRSRWRQCKKKVQCRGNVFVCKKTSCSHTTNCIDCLATEAISVIDL